MELSGYHRHFPLFHKKKWFNNHLGPLVNYQLGPQAFFKIQFNNVWTFTI